MSITSSSSSPSKTSFLDPTSPFDPLDKNNYSGNPLLEGGNGRSSSFKKKIPTLISFFLIGISSWLLVTGIFTECNVLAKTAPEGKKIFAASDLAIEMGNIVPFILVVYFSKFLDKNINGIVAFVILFDIFTALFLAFTYNKIVNNSSILFLIGCFFSGVGGSTSMMCYFAFSSQYGSTAITALSTGIGATGLIGLSLGIAQGANKPPVRYPPSIYFICMSIVIFFSLIGYFAAKTKLRSINSNTNNSMLKSSLLEEDDPDEIIRFEDDADDELNLLMRRSSSNASTAAWNDNYDKLVVSNRSCFKSIFDALVNPVIKGFKENIMSRPSPFIAIYISCLTEFGVPSILPYLIPSSLKKTGASFWMTFFFLTGSIGGRILTSVWSYRNFAVLNTIQTALFIYLIVICSLQRFDSEPIVQLPISFLLMFLLSFVHGFIVTEVFQSVSDSKILSSWAGLSNQAGALSGSVITFIIVQMGLFKTA